MVELEICASVKPLRSERTLCAKAEVDRVGFGEVGDQESVRPRQLWQEEIPRSGWWYKSKADVG